jgi:hypothetical protein
MSYSQYEFMKAEWIANNPTASHIQYQQAMQRIAKLCKV